MNFAVACAPIIGSYITLYFHWQGNFAVLLSLGLAAFIMSILFIPRNKSHQARSSTLGYVAIFSSKPLMLLITCIVMVFVPYWIFVGMSPLLYIKDFGVSLRHFGYYQGILALVFSIGSVLFGFIIKNNNYPQEKLLLIANQILIISFVILLLILNSNHPLIITLGFLPFIIGQIIPSTILYPLSLNYFPEAKGQVSAIIQGARLIISAIGLQIAGFFYRGNFKNIGICIIIFIFLAIVILFFILRKEKPYSDLAK